MFKEKVNARTDGRTTDNGPWHKLADLRPVELKMLASKKILVTNMFALFCSVLSKVTDYQMYVLFIAWALFHLSSANASV